MKRRFIVLVDFSEYSEAAVRFAYTLSRLSDAGLLLVNNTIVMSPAFTDEFSKKSMAQSANDKAVDSLRDLAWKLLPTGTEDVEFLASQMHITLLLQSLVGEPYENIVFAGVKGTGFLKQLFIGSTILQVIEHVDCTISVVPKGISSFSHNRIFIAVTEKYPLNTNALALLLNVVKPVVKKIIFFHVRKTEEQSEGMEKLLENLAGQFRQDFDTQYEIYERADFFETIKKVIKDTTSDMLVLQKGSRLFKDMLFRKFFINDLVYEGQIPMIILP